MTKQQLISWISMAVLLTSAATAFGQAPRLTRSSLQHDPAIGDYFNITIHAKRFDYCVLFFSLAKRSQRIDLPTALGGQVEIGLSTLAIYASTVDRIRFDDKGKWTHQLVVPPMLRGLVRTLDLDLSLYFQAITFRGAGPLLSNHVSNVLAVPLGDNPPTTRLGSALDLLRRRARRGADSYGRRPVVAEPIRRFDLFGNRILQPRLRIR